MQIAVHSRRTLEALQPTAPYALLSFRDPRTPTVDAPGQVARRLDVVFHDVSTPMHGLVTPSAELVAQIVRFLSTVNEDLVIQCEAGISRSVAAAAAIGRAGGASGWQELLRAGTHNRLLYRLLSIALGQPVPAEPLVCLSVRLKYPLDRMAAFASSMRRQRYDNWHVAFVGDGHLWEAYEDHGITMADRFSLIETPEPKGLWGHPWRQRGIDACLARGAEFVGLSNDDNYYTPGYFEQMVMAAQETTADLVLCDMLHSYSGWSVVRGDPKIGSADVGNWLASADLIRDVPWSGDDFEADGRFVARLAARARRVARVPRPLFVKN